MLRALFLLCQATSGTLLVLIGLPLSVLHEPDGKLNRKGRICLLVGCLSLLVGVIINDRTADASDKRNKQIIENLETAERSEARIYEQLKIIRDELFKERSERVMLIPAASPSAYPAIESHGDLVEVKVPQPGASVQWRHLVKGTVAENPRELWVIVHPVETGAFWVQPTVHVAQSLDWSVSAYFGRGSSIDRGKLFDIMAIADPEENLIEAQVLSDWPQARWKSKVVTVVRE